MLIRGKSKEAIARCLSAYAEASGRAVTPRTFVFTTQGYGYPLACLFSHPEVLGFAITGKAALLSLPLAAAAVRVKNNIRVFHDFPNRAVTAKIALPSDHRTGSLASEIAARRIVRDGTSFRLPALLAHDEAGSAWLEEEFIAGPAVAEPDKVARFLGGAAQQMYRAAPSSITLADALPMMGLTTDDVTAIGGLPGAGPDILTRRLSCGFIHGDLSPANMLVAGDGTLYLIDWELAATAPIAWDLKKIFTYDKAGTLAVLDQLRAATDSSAPAQMHAALCCQLAALRLGRERRLAYLVGNRNKSRAGAEAMVAKQEQELSAWIAELAEGAAA